MPDEEIVTSFDLCYKRASSSSGGMGLRKVQYLIEKYNI
jgi:hypothetical protein